MADISKILGVSGTAASMVPGIGTAVGAGLSVAGQIFGAVKGAQANKANQKLINTQMEENEADKNLTVDRSFLETNAAKDAVRTANENLIDNQKRVEGNAAITGASDEGKVASQSAVNKNYNDVVSNIASNATQYQDNNRRMYNARKGQLNNLQMQFNNQKAESASNMAGNASDLLGSLTFGDGMKSTNNTAAPGRTAQQTVDLNKIAKSAFN